MVRILLDSTVLIDALRGRPAADRVRRMRRSGDEPWVCVISIEEIWRGLRSDEEHTAERLVRGLRLSPLRAVEARLAGTWRREFAARGVTLHQADCLIAASAVGADATLATANVDDYPMPGLSFQHWPVGS
jgi:predicted nucleic acid-binding protein